MPMPEIQTHPTLVAVEKALVTPISNDEHARKLRRVLGYVPWQTEGRDERVDSWAAQMTDAGFPLIVSLGQLVSQFKYAASVTGNYCSHKNSIIRYAGDIPDFALDRFEKARAVDIAVRHGPSTIHSNMPLPVRAERLIQIDPVLVLWHWHAGSNGNWLDVTGEAVYKKGGWSNTLGVVVAMWDMDKELVLNANA